MYFYTQFVCFLLLNFLSYSAEADPHPLQQLHRAVARKDRTTVGQLLTVHQHYIDTPLAQDSLTLLHKAARHQHLLMIKLLIGHNAYIDPLDNTGSTPLHLAFTLREEVVPIHGGPVPNGRATIRHLEKQNQINVVYELVKNGAAIYLPNNGEQTPVDLAENHLQAKEKMLELYNERQQTIRSLIVTAIPNFPVDMASLIAEFTG